MFAVFKNFLTACVGLKEFNAIPRLERRVVFYSEGPAYWTYFQAVFETLWKEFGVQVLYVTSTIQDPMLKYESDGMRSYYVGFGMIRTIFFQMLDVDILVMTMPDLQTFHLKKSAYSVKYIYLHHSMVSTHMIYRPAAFDAFDTILCCGPHHFQEIRARESVYDLPAKDLVEHGYGRLDMILSQHRSRKKNPTRKDNQITVLVAPTWGENSLLELIGKELVASLLEAGLHVVIRPHPRTRLLKPFVLDQIAKRFATNSRLIMNEKVLDIDAFMTADILISDWSGAALEFAFGTEQPVIFIDVPRKVLNSQYQTLGIEPLEASIREKIGLIVSPEVICDIGKIAVSLHSSQDAYKHSIRELREEVVYNLGSSGRAAATYIHDLLIKIGKKK